MNFCTTLRTISGGRPLKWIDASRRLRNSGENKRLIASSFSSSFRPRPKPMPWRAASAAPALVVMIKMTFLKSTFLPFASVKAPWSITCKRMLNRSGCAFSISSSKQHRMWMLVDAIGQQTALIVADIAWRRPDQTRDGVALHVFRHVEAQELDAHDIGERTRDFGFADARWPREKIATDRLLRFAQARARHFDRRGELIDRRFLAEHHAFQIARQRGQHFAVVLRHRLRRDARHARHRLPRLPPRRSPACAGSAATASSKRRFRRSRRWPYPAACGRPCDALKVRPPF